VVRRSGTSEYGADKVDAWVIDSNGDPIAGTGKDFLTGLSGAKGAVMDPVSGDFSLPVIEPAACGVVMAEALLRIGLRPSKVGNSRCRQGCACPAPARLPTEGRHSRPGA
jgi:hypothetical protein